MQYCIESLKETLLSTQRPSFPHILDLDTNKNNASRINISQEEDLLAQSVLLEHPS